MQIQNTKKGMSKMKFSVVLCVKNEESRIRDCLISVYLNKPAEIIVVDGGSTDNTLKIVAEFAGIRIVKSGDSNLTRDRQKGVDAVTNELFAMIDADHRLKEGDLDSLYNDMLKYDLDIVQSGLLSFQNHGFWDSAEEEVWKMNLNIPGVRRMIGTAPAMYKKKVFKYVKFEDDITATIDDTDFMYRLSKFPEFKVGIGETNVAQLHFSDFNTYLNKFKWYGKGDGEFCKKHPERAFSMIYHLLIRYPIIYSIKAVTKGYFKAIPFLILQGLLRLKSLVFFLIGSILKK